MKKKIAIIGNSKKFIKILSTTYRGSKFKIYSWRNIKNLNFKKNNIGKQYDIILVCGYDYNSQWYSYEEYYSINILMPLKLTKFLANKKSIVIFINTIDNIKKKIYLKIDSLYQGMNLQKKN